MVPRFFNRKWRRTGWRKQQTLKLLISHTLRNDFYVVLDGKNHFIRPVNRATFVTADGKMKSFRARQQGSLRPYFVNACAYFGLDPELYVNSAMPATTPFVLSRRLVRELLDAIQVQERTPFTEFFHAPKRKKKMYFAFIKVPRHSPIDDLYKFGKRNTVTLFTRWPDTKEQLETRL